MGAVMGEAEHNAAINAAFWAEQQARQAIMAEAAAAGRIFDLSTDPCDGWQRDARNGRYWPAERPELPSMEGFDHRATPPVLAKFLTYIRTDWHHWSHGKDWTLESGPDSAPSSIDVVVPYSYRGPTSDSWTSYGGQPGDPAEVEIGTAWFLDDAGVRCEVNLFGAEADRVETWIYENPPDDDYDDGDY